MLTPHVLDGGTSGLPSPRCRASPGVEGGQMYFVSGALAEESADVGGEFGVVLEEESVGGVRVDLQDRVRRSGLPRAGR